MSTDTWPKERAGSIVIDGISYIPSSALLTGIPKISFKGGRAFGVVDSQGEAPRIYSAGSELGIYYNDTRHLGVWEMTFNGSSPISLAHELRFGGNTVVFSMTNRDLKEIGGSGRIRRDTFLIRRILTFCEDVLFETVELKNFDNRPHDLQVEQWVGGRFDDVFEVRGFLRGKRGKMISTEEHDRPGQRISVLQYQGLDDTTRRTYVRRLFDAEKIRISPSLVGYFTRVHVPSKGTAQLKTIVSFDRLAEDIFFGMPYSEVSTADKMRLLFKGSKLGPLEETKIESDNPIITRSIGNAQTDIYMLLTLEEQGSGLYPYAGIPWFSAPFGRDGIITAYQLLPWFPNVAKGVLNYVFSRLGTKVDPFTEEQPGKVFHELRLGEMAKTREVPFVPYYGSVDATPLVLILLNEYIRWTADYKSLKEWWPSARRALEWIEKWGDPSQTGFLEYFKHSENGLVNQGWKDSHDSVMHKEGALAVGPIRLCEVQGYAFRARMGMSSLARLLGQHDFSVQLRREALELKARFTEYYWDSRDQYIYLALDGAMRPCEVVSSNMGHCLWSQIVSSDQAHSMTRQLISDTMFSGHGIRTLADTEFAYNPLSYHNGSIWPHENSMIMEGFRMYGHTQALEKLSLALIEVLESSDDFRLPELYCGFRKRGSEPPIPYEVACKPQAWAAGSIFLMLKSMLGLSMDLDQDYLVVNNPLLTSKMGSLEVKDLMVRNSKIDLSFTRISSGTRVQSHVREGGIRVLTIR